MKNDLIKLSILVGLLVYSFSSRAQSFGDKSQLATQMLLQDLSLKSPLISVQTQIINQEPTLDWYQVVLTHPQAGEVKLLLKGPTGFLQNSKKQFAAVLIAAGFFTGQDSLKFLGDFPDSVLVGFSYPVGPEQLQKDPMRAFDFVRKTSAQMALTLRWMSEQGWANQEKQTAIGVSLGGIFLPASVHMAQSLGVETPRTIFVCTGAHLTPIIEEQARHYVGENEAKIIGLLVANTTSLHDPKLHLAAIHGKSLVLNADQDELIRESSSHYLQEMLPNATVEILHGPHINTDQPDVIKQAAEAILKWL